MTDPFPFRKLFYLLTRALMGDPFSFLTGGVNSCARPLLDFRSRSIHKKLPGLFQSCARVLQPRYIHVPRTIDDAAGCECPRGWHGFLIPPAMDFAMTVSKREAASIMMIVAGQIAQFVDRGIGRGIAVHNGHEITPVDDVLPHVEENKEF